MEMEREAYNFFNGYAEKFNDTKGRDIFLKFAEEEQEHYETINDRAGAAAKGSFLTRPPIRPSPSGSYAGHRQCDD